MVVPVVGWLAAVLGHGIWNLGASIAIGLLSIGLERIYFLPEWQALIIAGVIGGLPFSIPPLLTAVIVALLGREQDERVVRQYLPIEVGLGTLTTAEADGVITPARRKERIVDAQTRNGRPGKRQQKRFNEIAVRLAYFHYHAIRGERPYLPEIRRAEQLRWQLSALRWSILNDHQWT